MIDSTGENATRVASSELVVMQVDDSDSGEYQCTVTNRDVVDGVNATADVTVTCKWYIHAVIIDIFMCNNLWYTTLNLVTKNIKNAWL